jgi:hypothetical protein
MPKAYDCRLASIYLRAISSPLLPSLGLKDELNLSVTPRAGVGDLRSETDSLHIPPGHHTIYQLVCAECDSLPDRMIVERHAVSYVRVTTYHQLLTLRTLKLYVPKTKTGISG